MTFDNGRYSSRLPGFYNLKVADRNRMLQRMLPSQRYELKRLLGEPLPLEVADELIENVIGVFGMPLGIAANFRINDRDYLIPMAVEETSIVAAASGAAKLVRDHGSLTATASEPIMIGQIQIVGVEDFDKAEAEIMEAMPQLLSLANAQDPTLTELGGGAKDLICRRVETSSGPMLILHLHVDVRDAMGANAVNSMAEALGPIVAEMARGEVVCQIISNLSDKRTVRASMEISTEVLGKKDMDGPRVAERIVQAAAMAESDPYRAATQNKGIMNAIDAILIATGNDWRAVEAGAHAFAARGDSYSSLTKFTVDGEMLCGEIELPLALGIVGGVTAIHPEVRLAHEILGARSAGELAEVVTAVGLIQNFAALRALVSEGIQSGHMSLHARNLAHSAGAKGTLIVRIAERMIQEGRVKYDRAREILASFREQGLTDPAQTL